MTKMLAYIFRQTKRIVIVIFLPYPFCSDRHAKCDVQFSQKSTMLGWCVLTHWGRDQIDAISQTTFSNAFPWLKMFQFRFNFYWHLLLGVQSIIFQHCFRWWLGAFQATSHYLNQWWIVYRRIYASLGLNELRHSFNLFASRVWRST